MTWAQESTRKFDFAESRTSKRVGPGSYDISKAYERKTKSALLRTFPSGERNAFPRPEIVTPGPGAYELEANSSKKRPMSSFFQSRVSRDVYKITSTVPGSDVYSQLTEWGKVKRGVAPPNRPKRHQRPPHVPETANYLDEKGRLVRRKERKRTEADIGPGTYSPQDTSTVSVAEINKTKRTDDVFNIGKDTNPGPTKYSIPDVSSKLPVTIGNRTGSVLVKEITQAIGKPDNYKIPKGHNSIFMSKVQRKVYDVEGDVPGPGAYNDEAVGAIKPKPKEEYYDTGVVFGTRSVRFDDPSTPSPGPPAYSPIYQSTHDERGASALKNRAKMPDIFPGNDVVGPGAYDMPTQKLKPQLSPAFADKEPRLPSSENDLPGPADYTIDQYPDEKQAYIFETRYSMQNDWAFNNMSVAPSAEAFYIDRSLGGRGWTISRNQRFRKDKDNGNPAPGQYNYNEPFVKPSFNAAVRQSK